MVNQALAHNAHGFKAAVRMAGKAGHAVAVVHAPAVPVAEVLAHVAASQRCLRAHVGIGLGVGIVVVDAKQERVECLPALGERFDAENAAGVTAGVA